MIMRVSERIVDLITCYFMLLNVRTQTYRIVDVSMNAGPIETLKMRSCFIKLIIAQIIFLLN